MPRIGVYLLFFVSGIAGLVYQVVWVRWFGNVFGNTVYSASLVTAVFMSGLGIGAYLAGILADRWHREPARLLRAYGLFEGGVAILGLLIAFILPNLEALSAGMSTYVQDGRFYTLSVGSYLLRYVSAVVLLLPITTLLGGTLTLLVRYLVRNDLASAGVRIGALYGANTAGAALGAFLVDFTLVPRLGLFATQSFAVVINLGVCLVAIRWAPGALHASAAQPNGPAEEGSDVSEPDRPDPEGRRLLVLTSLAILFSGFAAMGMEMLWFRFLGTVLGSVRSTFSLLLTVILLGMWLGSTTAGLLHRRFGQAARLYIISQAVFCFLAVWLFLTYDKGLIAPLKVDEPTGWQQLVHDITPILFVAALPAFLMGFAYPLANANIQRARASVGRRAGLLYLANTVGAVAGSLLTGFLILPAIGVQATVGVLAIVALLAIPPLWVTARHDAPALPFSVGAWASTAAAVVLAVVWWTRSADHLSSRLYHTLSDEEVVLTLSEDINETILITEHPASGERILYTNGHPMTGTHYAGQRYMRAFVHIPLLHIDAPKRVLVICFGVGNTAHAASLHPTVDTLEIAELSRHVLEHASYFERWNHGVVSDPRVLLFINDGRQHLRMRPENHYDLITLEPPPITHAGVSALYSQEFYELASSRLKKGGFLTQWLPIYQVSGPVARSSIKAFVNAFPNAVLLSGFSRELILMGRKDTPITLDPAAVAQRVGQRPAVLDDLRRIDLGTMLEFVGTYAGSAASMKAATEGVPAVTDDLPLMEYRGSDVGANVIPFDIFDTASARDWCPGCFGADGKPNAAMADLDTYLIMMNSLYASMARAGRPESMDAVIDAPLDARRRTRSKSGYLQRIISH